jgi:TonB family protein
MCWRECGLQNDSKFLKEFRTANQRLYGEEAQVKGKFVKNHLAFVCVFFIFAQSAAQSEPAVSDPTSPHLKQRLPSTIALNIYQKLLDAAKVPPSPPAISSPKRLAKIMKRKVGGRSVSCKLTLTPSGEISNLVIVKSSGSAIRDRRAIRFIRSAGPFGPNELFGPSDYLVEFPVLSVLAVGY